MKKIVLTVLLTGCIFIDAQAQTSEDCFTAEYLCNSNSISVPVNSATSGTIAEPPYCFPTSSSDSGAHWYQFTPLTSGNLHFSITPSGNADYDFAVYDVTTGCQFPFLLDCDYTPSVGIVTGLGCPSIACHSSLPIAAGSTYAILVSRRTAGTIGFTLDFTGSTAVFGGVPIPAFISSEPACTGVPVNFTNQSTTTNQSLMFTWNFGDSNTSTLTNPSHSYSSQGTYLATLTASCGVNSNVFQDSVHINCDSCSASFALYADTNQLHTYWAISNVTGIPPLSYLWNWGDSTYDSIPYPSHTYANAGFYTICLTITDSTGCISSYCDTFTLARMNTANTMVYVNVVNSIPTGIKENNELNFFVYPNPSIEEIILHFNREGLFNVQLFNTLGKILKQAQVNSASFSVDVSQLPPGIYFITVADQAGNKVTKKVVKM